MRTAPRRRRAGRSALPLLLALSMMPFTAGLAVGWIWAVACGQAPEKLYSEPVSSQEEFPASPSEPKTDNFPSAAASWNLVLINRDHPLSEEFQVPELTQLANGQAVDSRAYPQLQRMMDDCRAQGLQPLICSSYRTWEKQETLFSRKVQEYLASGLTQGEAEEQAAVWVAPPGTSEHQTGLALDIVDKNYQVLDEKQEDTGVQRWLMAHCGEYGFILRYPTGKSDITGIVYEPWHYRYVGAEAARKISESGQCLEEYLAEEMG